MTTQPEFKLEAFKQTRKLIIGIADGFTDEKLLLIPNGFNNNALWHIGHVLVTQQLLVYKLSGVPMLLDEQIISAFRKDSNPKEWTETPNADAIKKQLQPLMDRFIEDYYADKFKSFERYESSYGVTLNNIDDSIQFLTLHESLHLGYLMALRRVVVPQD